jgi:alkylation response protein AidB-like acyl-CoA dehydrogenase
MPRLPRLPEDPIVHEVAAVAERLELARRYREIDLAPTFPQAEFRALGSAGLIGLRTPLALGGRGLSLPRAGVGLFHLAYRGGTTFAKLSLQPEFSSVLAEHGVPELVDRWYRPLVRGELLIGNQITEPSAGSDATAIAMSATRDGDTYLLEGEKSEAAFAADAAAALVYARVAGPDPRGGITAFVVPQDLTGISVRLTSGDLGERWMRRGTVRYDGVRIPASLRIGEEGEGFEYVRHELTREHALLASIYLGVARASWDETVEHVGARRAFGRPLAAQQAVAFPLVADGARLEATWLYTQSVLARLEAGEPVAGESALAKWMATEVALETLDHAIQFHGGRGYSRDLPHEQRYRDVRSGRIAHGPTEIMFHIAARQIWPRGPP